MQFKQIGDIKVPVIGQGTGFIKDKNVIKHGIDLGMTFIDTAESYDNEEIIGKAVKGIRDRVFISTKFSPEHNNSIAKACEGSLKRLGTDYIDLYFMHWPTPQVLIEKVMDELSKLKSEGKIKYIGLCNVSVNQLKDVKPDAIQTEYNLFDRSIERGILPYCGENDVLTIAYRPLRDWDMLNPDSMAWLQDIAFNHQRTIRQVILNWLICHKSVIAIPCSGNFRHQVENSQAGDFPLSMDEIEQINNLFPYEPSYIDPKLINITLSADRYPQTKKQAKKYWSVNPRELDLTDFKPVRITPTWEGNYEILEGGLRYWAWVIQKKNEPIPVIIKKRWIVAKEKPA